MILPIAGEKVCQRQTSPTKPKPSSPRALAFLTGEKVVGLLIDAATSELEGKLLKQDHIIPMNHYIIIEIAEDGLDFLGGVSRDAAGFSA